MLCHYQHGLRHPLSYIQRWSRVASTWTGIEYDGRWKIPHYKAKDIYQHVVIPPYSNITTGDLIVWVTSDLWDEVKGTTTFDWYDWSGKKLDVKTPQSVQFVVGLVNSTKVLQTDTMEVLNCHDTTDVVLRMQVQAKGRCPKLDVKVTFRHEHCWSALSLNTARLQDPGLRLTYSKTNQAFTVKATTGIAAWMWLDYPDGLLLSLDSNAFWLAPADGCRSAIRSRTIPRTAL